jgi:hypothetical protein
LNPEVLHLHTYFFFPISIDQAAVMAEHPEIYSENSLDFTSPTNQDMMFFHPFVRRAFFDTGDSNMFRSRYKMGAPQHAPACRGVSRLRPGILRAKAHIAV